MNNADLVCILLTSIPSGINERWLADKTWKIAWHVMARVDTHRMEGETLVHGRKGSCARACVWERERKHAQASKLLVIF